MIEPQQFLDLKLWLIDLVNVSRDALHIHIGLVVFLGLWLIFGRRWVGFLAWLVVLGMAVYGEMLDHANELPNLPDFVESEHPRDVINTMIWPTILLILGWFILGRKSSDDVGPDMNDDDAAGDSGDLPDESLEKPPTV